MYVALSNQVLTLRIRPRYFLYSDYLILCRRNTSWPWHGHEHGHGGRHCCFCHRYHRSPFGFGLFACEINWTRFVNVLSSQVELFPLVVPGFFPTSSWRTFPVFFSAAQLVRTAGLSYDGFCNRWQTGLLSLYFDEAEFLGRISVNIKLHLSLCIMEYADD